MKSPRLRAVLSGLAAAVVALAIPVLAAPAASALPIIPPTPLNGTLNVHKHQTPSSATPGDGLTLGTAPTGAPIEGVVFTVQKLNFDLRTNAGWNALTAMPIGSVATYFDGASQTMPATSATGLSTMSLPVGAYYVTETTFPDGVSPVTPFIVTLPMTHPTVLDTWVYDVHVYPKNAVTPPPKKTVTDAGVYMLGQNVLFAVATEIPDLPSGQSINAYRVRDELAPQLTYGSTTVSLSTGTPVLEPTTHFTVAVTGQQVLVTFTPAGLTLLQANNTQLVVTTITTQVNAVGEITNQAAVFPNEESWQAGAGVGVLSNVVKTEWGSIEITKTETDTPAVLLADAKFKVYPTEQDALDDTNAISLTTNPNAADRSVWITDAAGVLTVEGLRYSHTVDGFEVEAGEPDVRQYWFVEIEAPPGYELLARPFMVEVDSPLQQVPVSNPPKGAGFELPFTGGSGLWLFPIGGVFLLGGAVLLVLARRRRDRVQA